MKHLLLSAALLFIGASVSAQNINDHKIGFQYIQLPLIKIDESLTEYAVVIEHDYLKANEDSLALFEIRKEATMNVFHQMMTSYQLQVDSLNRNQLILMADWEKKVNAGTKNPDGTELAMPASPIYPMPPSYPQMDSVRLNSPLDEATFANTIAIEGFEKGDNDITVTLSIQAIQFFPVVETKSGTGATTKYTYRMPYTLPINVKVESATQGVILQEEMNTGQQSYSLGSYKSKYEFDLYVMDNEDEMYAKVEAGARNSAIQQINNYLNEQIGFPLKTRGTELYSVKKFKDYDYTDVTQAFTLTSQALYKVKIDRDHSTALPEIDAAIAAIDAILAESNTFDNKARINDKITAMLQCNKIELLIWKADFNEAYGLMDLVMNSGEGKAKRHVDDLRGYYMNLQKRWEMHY